MNQKQKTEIEKLCRENKALDSKFIDPKSIVVGHWVRFKCQYGCGGYGKSLSCPPHSPTPDETKKIISDYSVALLAHFDAEANVSKTVATIEREIFLMNYHKVISFGAGPCRLCKECNLTECKFPRLARPSMEASGIDVFSTALNNGYPIRTLRTKDEERNRYGLILIE